MILGRPAAEETIMITKLAVQHRRNSAHPSPFEIFLCSQNKKSHSLVAKDQLCGRQHLIHDYALHALAIWRDQTIANDPALQCQAKPQLPYGYRVVLLPSGTTHSLQELSKHNQ